MTSHIDFSQHLDLASVSRGMVEFDILGTILNANDNFLHIMGYTINDILGKHHSLFVKCNYAQSEKYKHFWQQLRQGEYIVEEHQYFNSYGQQIWLQASYNPLFNAYGEPFKIVCYTTDITLDKLKRIDPHVEVSHICKAHFLVEYDMQGKVLSANHNFLDNLGFSLKEIKGKHQKEFLAVQKHNALWKVVAVGGSYQAELCYRTKNGQELWVRSNFSPVFDMQQKPVKVIEYGVDITNQICALRLNITTIASSPINKKAEKFADNDVTEETGPVFQAIYAMYSKIKSNSYQHKS